MKKGILPLKLFLIITILGGLAVSFMAFTDLPDVLLQNNTKQTNSHKVGPSLEHLAKIRNNQVTGLISPNDLKIVQGELEKIGEQRAINMDWQQLGPDNFGGRTRAIHFTNPDGGNPIAYAGAVSGGLWKSDNLGTTWSKINMESYNLNVSSITQTPNGKMFVGTGEVFDAHSNSGLEDMGYSSGFMGQGIFISTDGENFSLLESTKPQFNDIESDWAFVNELAADPTNGRVYAATNTGLKYSNDDGQTWKTVKDSEGTELTMNSLDVQVGSDGVVVACIDNLCYISADGDVNGFVLRSTGDSISLPDVGVNRIEFAIAPSDPNILYASVVNSQGHVYNIYLSENKGAEWKVILPGTASVPIFSQAQNGVYLGFGEGVYHNAITVFPNNPDKVLLGGIDAWQGKKIQENGFFEWINISESNNIDLVSTYVHENHHVYTFFPGSDDRFLIGNDGGVRIGNISGDIYEFETSNRNYLTTQFYTIGYSGFKDYVVGGTQSDGVITLPGFGNTNSEGIKILPFFGAGVGGPCVVSSIVPNVIVIGADAGIIRRSDDFGANYSAPDQFPGTIGNPTAFSTPMVLVENFNNLYSSDSNWYHADQYIPGGSKLTIRSVNSGQPFTYTLPQDVELNEGDSILIQDIVTAYYYLGVASGIYFTKEVHQFDKEPEWFVISNSDFGLDGIPYSMAITADGNHLFVGTLDGKLYRISNLATAYNFERADVTSPGCIVSTQPIELIVPGSETENEQVITSIAIDPNDPNNLMITLGNYGNDHYVLYSNNALAQFPEFSSKQGNLPHMPVYSSIIEMKNPKVAILGTEHGIFVTENILADQPQWSRNNTNMGNVPVFDLKQQIIDQPSKTIKITNGNEVTWITYPGTENWGSIYAATFGRGVFRSDAYFLVGIDEFGESDLTDQNNLFVYPNPVHSDAIIEFNSEKNSVVDINVYDLNGKLVKANASQVHKGLNKITLNVGHLSKGTYIMQLISGNRTYTSKFLVK